MANPFPIQSLQTAIPLYLYQEYSDDDDLQAIVGAINTLAQQYVNWFNQINLPVYTGPLIVGSLLDWVATGIYGIARPTIPLASTITIGEFNTYELNSIQFDQTIKESPSTYTTLDDDFYKRLLTWHLYLGDGKQTSIWWLRRRVMRFLTGMNGTDIVQGDPSSVSIEISAGVVSIAIKATANTMTAANTFAQCVAAGVLALPFQYTYSVTVSS